MLPDLNLATYFWMGRVEDSSRRTLMASGGSVLLIAFETLGELSDISRLVDQSDKALQLR